ncbi:T6SS phospholipase effector Tle1-like catalytic domain-containing protein [Reinekea marina]|uniref:T6SS phospholipase effector Tle1-like catalytic domain-containing protein n=2 Tax=Reinekea marina TaxID=1310421 RepID=A0ABV7WSB7_9GAMM
MDSEISFDLQSELITEAIAKKTKKPTLLPLSFIAYRQLPHHIQQHYRADSKPLCKVEKDQLNSFRNNPLLDIWVKTGRKWVKETHFSHRYTSESIALIPLHALQEVNGEAESTYVHSESALQSSFAKKIAQNWGSEKLRSTNVHLSTQSGDVPQVSIANRGASVLTKGGKNVIPNIKDYAWQEGDTPSSVAMATRGHQDARGLFGFDTFYSNKNLPRAGNKVRIQHGWKLNLHGHAQNAKFVRLSWHGPVSGDHSFVFEGKHKDEVIDWQLDVELLPGDYTITAQSGETVTSQNIKILGSKTLQFGLFFDGTGKNYNADKHCETDEFEPSNIAKLYECYKPSMATGVGRHYIDGIGTVDVENEVKICQDVAPGWKEKLAQAFGYGMKVRMEEAYSRLVKFLSTIKCTEFEVLNLQIDVFGYSRGAASARAFINDFNKRTEAGGLPDQLLELDRINFRFLGLFETVGSVGIPGDKFNCPYNLNLDFSSANAVYQLCALHEQRAYFPLSSIKSKPGQLTPHNFKEEYIPGAHADIGGGQALAEHPKTATLSRFLVGYLKDNQKSKRKAERKVVTKIAKVKENYASWGGEFNVKRKEKLNENGSAINIHVEITLIRAINPKLEHYALDKMYQHAHKHYLPLHELNILELHRLRHDVPDKLVEHVNNAKKGSVQSMDWLKANYIELSHQPDAPKGDLLHVDKPEKNAVYTTPLGVRELFYNQCEKAL